MALAVSLLGSATFNTTAGNKTVVATPTLGDMIIVICAATGPTGATVGLTDNNTDGHGNPGYTLIVGPLMGVSANPMFAFVRADPIRSATSTTWTSTQTASTGGGLAVLRVTGAQLCGPAFIRQSGSQSNQTATAAPTIALGTGAALTGNALITAVFDAAGAAPGLTVPTSWAAADFSGGYTVPSAGLEITHINSGFTGSTVTWGSTDATGTWCSLAFEMSAAAAGHMGEEGEEHSDPFSIQVMDRASVLRGAYF